MFGFFKSKSTVLGEKEKAQLRQSLVENFYAIQIPFLCGYSHEVFLSTEGGRNDMENHVEGRTKEFRGNVIPWMESVAPLKGRKILEIGAGTGSSIVALSEAGAVVDGLDVDEGCLKVARLRSELHGIKDGEFFAMNGADIGRLSGRGYDLIIFSASLEHMTHEERQASLRAAWDMLPVGGHLCVYETPNRLWFFDGHTSLTNYYNWLPDSVALDYTAKSPRDGFSKAFRERGEDKTDAVKLARWGRGVSFHDFELAIGLDRLEVHASLQEFLRQSGKSPDWTGTLWQKFHGILGEIEPGMPKAFNEDMLNLMLTKTK